MSRILTGIQSTGRPHLGNILGAIQPAINLSKQSKKCYLLTSDIHEYNDIKKISNQVFYIGDGG